MTKGRRKLRVLIVGINSNIGDALAVRLRKSGAIVYGSSRRDNAVYDNKTLKLDLANPDHLPNTLPKVDVAIFCAAMAKFADCRSMPALAKRVNVESVSKLSTKLVGEGSRVILLSTSAVFDGKTPFRNAADQVSPNSEYGKLKAAAEAEVLKLGKLATVFRLTKIVSAQTPLFVDWKEMLAKGENIQAFGDLFFSPLLAEHVVDALEAVIVAQEGGIFQISGAEDISYFEAANWLAQHWGASSEQICKVKAGTFGVPDNELLSKTTLDTRRLTELTKFSPPSPQKVLGELEL
jgi:dTDP-4-dehydrorhamnose reductase